MPRQLFSKKLEDNVEAFQWDGRNLGEALDFLSDERGPKLAMTKSHLFIDFGFDRRSYLVPRGGWIIQRWPDLEVLTAEEFEATYEPVNYDGDMAAGDESYGTPGYVDSFSSATEQQLAILSEVLDSRFRRPLLPNDLVDRVAMIREHVTEIRLGSSCACGKTNPRTELLQVAALALEEIESYDRSTKSREGAGSV